MMTLALPRTALAQERPVKGTVRDSRDNAPLAGASVQNRRTKKVVQTDENGAYSIEASPGDLLVITHIGHKSLRLTVGAGTTYVTQLDIAEGQMSDVVVTAMDIKRNPKELGFSTQTLSGKTIQETQRENFVNGLQGRIAGLSITPTSGQAGASSTVTLRGFNTSGVNQPLFIIDGIIVDNSTFDENSNSGAGLGLASDRPNRTSDYTNRIADINPDDIESITVLKGPEAAILYGSKASSGAIVITTKKPTINGRFALSYDNSFRIQKINRFPKTIADFGPGVNGSPSTTTFADFGPGLPGNTPTYDNVDHAFRTGFAQTHNLEANWGNKFTAFRMSGSYFDEDGVVPNNNFQRLTVRLSNSTKIGKWIDLNPSISYVNEVNTVPGRGAGGFLYDLLQWPVTNDIRHYQDANGNRVFALPAADPSVESDNPLYNARTDYGKDNTYRMIATMGIDIHPLDWLTLSGRFGYDTYATDGFDVYGPQSSDPVSISGTTTGAYNLKGALENTYQRYFDYNHTIYATAKHKFGDWTVSLIAGTTYEDNEHKTFSVIGSQLIDPNRHDSSNTNPASRQRLLQNYYGRYNESIARNLAYFGEANIGYKDILYLSYTQRFEETSILPVANRSYNYPGASASLILSDLFPGMKRGDFINFAKLRGAMANSARLPDPYLNQSVFGNNYASSTVLAYSYGFFNNNPNLQPERQRTYELGTEWTLLKNILSLDVTYYNTYCYNQISQNARESYATGFVLNTINAASLRNQGLEITLDVNPVRTNDWNWDIQFNFNHTWSKVLTLPASIGPLNDYYNSDTYILNARAGLVRGHSTSTLTGWNYNRNNAGKILINPASGLPEVNQTFLPIGDRNPAFTLGTLNSIKYKHWSLSFLWDLKIGGDIFDGTDQTLTEFGKSPRTADRMTPRVVNGVLDDGLQNTATPTKNTILVNPYLNNSYYGETTGMPDEEFVQHNVNWLRLRDVTLSYGMPQQLLHRLKVVKSLIVFCTANDLILFTNYWGADPAVSGTTAATRGVGSFGYDYFNMPTPMQLNFGLRASF